MAIYNTPDGRQVVGSVESGNDYHGFNGKRDIIIQLTADGATTDGLNALEYLKAYAVEQNRQNKPIFPNGTRVFISANGYTKAVEADDIVIDGENITIGGIKWDGSAWDYSEAGQTGSGLPSVTEADAGKVLAVDNSGVWGAQEPIGKKFIVTCTPSDETLTFGQMDKTVGEIKQAVDAGMEVWFQMTFNVNLTGLYVCNGIDHYLDATFGYVFVAMFVINFGGNCYLARLTTSTISEDSTDWGSDIFSLTPAT